VNRPYYDAIGLEPCYSNEELLEQVYDDRNLEETEDELDWEILQEDEAILE
jgi:hypothetical protein